MSNQPSEVEAILSRWPSRQAIAGDVGVEPIAVYRWGKRGSIPARHDAALLASARRRRIRLSAQELIGLRSAHADQRGHGNVNVQDGTPQEAAE